MGLQAHYQYRRGAKVSQKGWVRCLRENRRPGAGCWVLGAGCWVVGAVLRREPSPRCWVLGAGCWVLGAGCLVRRYFRKLYLSFSFALACAVPLRGSQRGEVALRLALGFALAVGVLCALAPRLQPGGLLARPRAAFVAVAVPPRTAAGARKGRATAGRCGAQGTKSSRSLLRTRFAVESGPAPNPFSPPVWLPLMMPISTSPGSPALTPGSISAWEVMGSDSQPLILLR